MQDMQPEELPLRSNANKKKTKTLYILIGILIVVIGSTVYFGKASLDKKAAAKEQTKIEQKKKAETEESANKSGRKLRLVITGFSELYSDPTEKVFRTDITQSEVDLLKKLIAEVESEKLRKEFYSELEKVQVVK